MLEPILALVGLLLVMAFIACLLILPIVAVVQGQRISRLDRRLAQLERELLHASARETAPSVEALPVEPLPEEVVPEAPAEAPPEVIPTVLPVRQTAPRPITSRQVEEWLGGRGLGWAAVVLLLFAVAFFLKVAFDNQWVGELGRVTLGIVLGVLLCGAGLHYHRRGWRAFSQMLTAGGVVLLYLSTFATFGFYHLLPRDHAAVFLIALILEAGALAVLYNAPAIALMAVIGGLLTPVLLHSDRDQYVNLFLYLGALNAGVVGLSLLRRWPALGLVSLLGTHGLFWLWYAEHFHPAKRPATLTFLSVIFVLYLGQAVLASLLRRFTVWPFRALRPAGSAAPAPIGGGAIEDLVRLVVNSFLFALAGSILLDPDYHAWLGTLAVGLALVHTLLAWLVFVRRPQDGLLVLVLVAIAMAFVAWTIPLQAEATWIAVGWAVQGLALWWFGLRVRAAGVRGLGAVLLLLAIGRLLFVDTPEAHPRPFIPIFNRYGLPAVVVAGCVVAAGLIARRFLARLNPADQVLARCTGLAGVVLLWIVFSVEAYDSFAVRANELYLGVPPGPGAEVYDQQGRPLNEVRAEESRHLLQSAQVALSVVWAAYAAVVLAVGFRLPSQPLRWGALGLFGLTLGKVVLVDMSNLPGLYRVVAFLVLSLMMGAAAWGYQKMKALFLVNEPEGVRHEAV